MTSSRRWLFFALAIGGNAATCLPWLAKSPASQFFASRGVLDSPLKDREFLNHMAATVTNQWQPDQDDPNRFVEQMKAFCDSCDKLLATDLTQLVPTNRAELKVVCTRWRDKMRTLQAILFRQAAVGNIPTRSVSEGQSVWRMR